MNLKASTPLDCGIRCRSAAVCVLTLFIGIVSCIGQVNASRLERGVHYYAISNMINPTIPVLRGKAGSQGYAHDLIILAPNTQYREWILHLQTMRVAVTNYTTPDVGRSFQLPEFQLRTSTSPDSDGDGLHDLAEFILGTNPNNPDTDGDRIPDGVEVQNGTDPLDGLPASIGIIAATDTPGTAVDVCAINDLAVVANREAGVSVLNVAGQNPIRIAEVDTPGTALRVACFGNLIAVADGPAGLAIIDITDPPAARILHQVNLGSAVQAVTAAGGLAYAGLANGELVTVDLASGFVLSRRSLGASVEDLAFSGDYMLAVTSGALLVLNPYELDLPTLGSTGTSGALRLVAGNGIAYVTIGDGYSVFSITTNGVPSFVRQNRPGQNSWRHIVVNGSGHGIAATRARFTDPYEIELLVLPAPDQPPQIITQTDTPGDANSISIYNGRAYAADGASGLQVINYLAYDSGTNPPTIALSTSFALNTPTNGLTEEGKLARVTASVSDDVQVRNVEFYLDGARVLTDGNFPFDHRFVTPRMTASKTNFTLRAKATDTGGNFRWSDELLVTLSHDQSAPYVIGAVPTNSSFVSITNPPSAVFAYFNEPMDLSTINSSTYQLVWAGPDTRLGTVDDRLMTNATVTHRENLNAGVIELSAPLGLGVYQATISSNVTDAAGNPLAGNYSWIFAILAGGPDDDDDNDGLTNAQELAFGSNPFAADSDGDGWSDLDEFENGTNPADANARPPMTLVAYPPVEISLPSPDAAGTAGAPVFVAQPPAQIDLPGPDAAGVAGVGLVIAYPPVQIDLPSQDTFGNAGVGIVLARPPLQIDLPSADTFGSAGIAAVFAQPPVEFLLPSPDMDGSAGVPVHLALPPLQIDLPSPDTAGTNSAGLFLALPPVSIVITNQ